MVGQEKRIWPFIPKYRFPVSRKYVVGRGKADMGPSGGLV